MFWWVATGCFRISSGDRRSMFRDLRSEFRVSPQRVSVGVACFGVMRNKIFCWSPGDTLDLRRHCD